MGHSFNSISLSTDANLELETTLALFLARKLRLHGSLQIWLRPLCQEGIQTIPNQFVECFACSSVLFVLFLAPLFRGAGVPV